MNNMNNTNYTNDTKNTNGTNGTNDTNNIPHFDDTNSFGQYFINYLDTKFSNLHDDLQRDQSFIRDTDAPQTQFGPICRKVDDNGHKIPLTKSIVIQVIKEYLLIDSLVHGQSDDQKASHIYDLLLSCADAVVRTHFAICGVVLWRDMTRSDQEQLCAQVEERAGKLGVFIDRASTTQTPRKHDSWITRYFLQAKAETLCKANGR